MQALRIALVKYQGIATRSTLTMLLSLIAVTSYAYGQTREWTLNNGRVSRTLTFDARAGLTTSAWTNVETGTGFIEAGERSSSCREFRLHADDVTVTGAAEDVRIDGSPEVQHAGTSVRLDLALLAQKTPLELLCTMRRRPDLRASANG